MCNPSDLPVAPGSYLLILHVAHPAEIVIGRFGKVAVAPGWYLYTGSALGPGGLRGRLHHHLQPARRPYWHIDYLRQVGEVAEVWCVVDGRRWEHAWAAHLAQQATPAPCRGFGASDCRCAAHCFRVDVAPVLAEFAAAMQRSYLDHPLLHRFLIDG